MTIPLLGKAARSSDFQSYDVDENAKAIVVHNICKYSYLRNPFLGHRRNLRADHSETSMKFQPNDIWNSTVSNFQAFKPKSTMDMTDKNESRFFMSKALKLTRLMIARKSSKLLLLK